MRGETHYREVRSCDGANTNAHLVLHTATTFWTRLRGLHGIAPLRALQCMAAPWRAHGTAAPAQVLHGLYLSPCRAIHTLGLSRPVDVVFVDAQLNELKRVDSLRPNRFAGCRGATAVIELPAGYCKRYADYPLRIQAALTRGTMTPPGNL